MITENEVQPDGVVGDSPQQVLQAARNIIEADTADMEECGQNGGCGKDHADEIVHGEAVIKRIDRVINDPALGVPDDLTVALLYGDFCEADYAASWLEPTEQVVDEFEAWLPGAVAERTGSDTVREYLPRLKEAYGRAVEPSDERSKAAQACEYLAAQPESHWTVDVRLEGDDPQISVRTTTATRTACGTSWTTRETCWVSRSLTTRTRASATSTPLWGR